MHNCNVYNINIKQASQMKRNKKVYIMNLVTKASHKNIKKKKKKKTEKHSEISNKGPLNE